MKIRRAILALSIVVATLLAFAADASGQEPEWHCNWTEIPFETPGWAGEFEGNGTTSQPWTVDPIYTVTEVCVRTASGVTRHEISPAKSGTITANEPILGFSLFKVTEVPPTTTTTVPETTTTTEPETTTTTEPETTTTTEPDGSTTTTSTPPGTPTTAPRTPPTEPSEPCRGVWIDGECTTPSTGASTDPVIWLIAAVVAAAVGYGFVLLVRWLTPRKV